jgi:hypothetical protein
VEWFFNLPYSTKGSYCGTPANDAASMNSLFRMADWGNKNAGIGGVGETNAHA